MRMEQPECRTKQRAESFVIFFQSELNPAGNYDLKAVCQQSQIIQCII